MATATHPHPSPVVDNPRPVTKTPATPQQRGTPPTRLATIVDRTSHLSDDVLKSLQAGQRAAIETVGRFSVTVQEALPQEVQHTSEVAKKITESGLEMAQQLAHTQYDLLRQVIDSAAKSLSTRDAAKPK